MIPSAAQHLAKQIAAKLGARIDRACSGTLVPSSLLAGLVAVENCRMDLNAARFERHVFEMLKAVRSPLKFWRSSYNGTTTADLKGMSDDALANFAMSWGFCQVMGYHVLHNLENGDGGAVTISQLRDPELHLGYAVHLLHRVAAPQLKNFAFGDVLRIWNSGSPTGKTYDPNYVANALAVMQAYKILRAQSAPATSVSPPMTANAPSVEPAPGSPPASSPSTNQSAGDI